MIKSIALQFVSKFGLHFFLVMIHLINLNYKFKYKFMESFGMITGHKVEIKYF